MSVFVIRVVCCVVVVLEFGDLDVVGVETLKRLSRVERCRSTRKMSCGDLSTMRSEAPRCR